MAEIPSKSPYLRLPAELRNKIMDLILVRGDYHPHTPLSETYARSPHITTVAEIQPGIQLFATCKQAYGEGHAMFYSSNKFHLPSITTFDWPNKLQARHKALIKRISITLSLDNLDAVTMNQIETSVAREAVDNITTKLGIIIHRILSSVWKDKMRYIAAWTSLEQIEVRTLNQVQTLEHDVFVANIGDLDRRNQTLYWLSILEWPKTVVLAMLTTKVVEVGWRKTIDLLYEAKAEDFGEGSHVSI